MNKVREQYLVSEFKDFTGEERGFVICAVSKVDVHNTFFGDSSITIKNVSFGIAVQNHGDVFSLEKGKAMALNCAETRPFDIVTSGRTYSLNYDTIQAFLKSFERYFQQDPSMFIPSYKVHREKYNKDPKTYLERRAFQLQKEQKIENLQKELKEVKASKYIPSQETKLLKA